MVAMVEEATVEMAAMVEIFLACHLRCIHKSQLITIRILKIPTRIRYLTKRILRWTFERELQILMHEIS